MILDEIISIPGTQCGLANEPTLVTAINEAGKSSFLNSLVHSYELFVNCEACLKILKNSRILCDFLMQLL